MFVKGDRRKSPAGQTGTLRTWDVAKATGQAAPFQEDVAERGLAIARRQLHSRLEGAFGAEVKVPEDAAAIDRLAGFLGRRV